MTQNHLSLLFLHNGAFVVWCVFFVVFYFPLYVFVCVRLLVSWAVLYFDCPHFLFNFFSTHKHTQSEETANLLYSCDWQGKTSDEKNYGGRDHAVVMKPKSKPARFDFPCDVEAMRIIKFIIKRSQKPLILMALKFSSLSLNTFSRVSSIIYTTQHNTHIKTFRACFFPSQAFALSVLFRFVLSWLFVFIFAKCFWSAWFGGFHLLTRSFYHHHHHHFAHSISVRICVCVRAWWCSFVFQFVYLFVGWIFHILFRCCCSLFLFFNEIWKMIPDFLTLFWLELF